MLKVYITENGKLQELNMEQLCKGCWIDMIAPTHDELEQVAAATGIQMDFLTAALDDDEKSRIEIEEDQILVLGDVPFLRSNNDYEALPLGIIVNKDYIVTVCLETNGITASFDEKNVRNIRTQYHTLFLYQILFKAATTRDTTNRKGLFECHLEDLINLEERLLIRDIDGKKHKEYQTKIEVVKFDANEIQNCGGHIEKQISVVVERIH